MTWVGAWSGTAAAEDIAGARAGPLIERAHDIRLTLHDDHAELVVRRTLDNVGDRREQATLWIDVPDGAVAVGLRTYVAPGGRSRWVEGEVLEAALAGARYQAPTDARADFVGPRALLSWDSWSRLLLQIVPCACAPERAERVEYTMVMPTVYADGRHGIVLPALGDASLPARVAVYGASTRDHLFIDGAPVRRGAVQSMDEGHAFAAARAGGPRLEGGLAMIPLRGGDTLLHYHLEAAPALSRVPRRADVVILLDRSRSLDEGVLEAERVLALETLAHFDGGTTRAAVIAFDRRAEDLTGGLVSVAEARAGLASAALPRRNGSDIDAALAHAERLLARSGSRPRRLVVLSDRATRSSLTAARVAAAALRTGALMQLVDVRAGVTALVRDDEDPWSATAAATGGVLWHASVGDEAPAVREAIFEELARPLRIDHLRLRAPGVADGAFEAPTTLREGSGAAAWLRGEIAASHVDARGDLWWAPIRRVLRSDVDEGRRWSALALPTEVGRALDGAQVLALALRGHAVSPGTSAVVTGAGGPTPAPELRDGGMMGLPGLGQGGGCRATGCSGSSTAATLVAPAPELASLLRGHLRDALAVCGRGGGRARVEIETTFAEIVEIRAPAVDGVAVDACVVEALWRTELSAAFGAPFAQWTVEVDR